MLVVTSFTFEHICSLFTEKACKVLTEKKEYEDNHGTTKTKLHVQMACGHNENISQNCFMRRTHYCCRQCMFKELQKVSYDTVQQIATTSLLERESFIHVEEVIKDAFSVSKTHEGCSSDMVIKPKNTTANEWIGIQLKSQNKAKNNSYSFNHVGKYTHEIVLCISFPSKKMWVFTGMQLQGQSMISIGENKSIYSSHEVSKSELINYLQNSYVNQEKYTKEALNIPRGQSNKKEHSYRLLREQIFQNKFDLKYPELDGSKFDIIINGYKVQDKCSQKRTTANSFIVNFKKVYSKGDNDFYWIFHKNESVYIIPEADLLIKNDKLKEQLTINDKLDIYCYKLNDPLILTKLQELFKVRI